MSTTAMIKTVNTLFAPPSDEVYTVFQSEGDLLDEANSHGARPADRKLGTLGFFGRVLEGTGIVAFALAIAIVTMTTGARAQNAVISESMLSSATGDYATATMVAMVAVFAIMLAMLRRTWRQTSRTIEQMPRGNHRIR